ncbi:SRPBCC family protein [Solirubrobacter ginsenosidimutans]|uniref:SRPBCC family protein n=1 Tax=Solirubrobacter ginsenosidimutans TaxID=490573 RepID=A0A9X3N4Y8_9ACTN|nr:SRPBCC family protein [Solirubrobacter ginsenosidimutans]MDA0164918.1 SRPBCC family protein [Solirubrobacter ginsenosidimutans]
MAKPGDVIDVPELGVRVEFRATAESTAGEYTEVDVIGEPRGFITVAHVHVGVTEHHTVIEGAMIVKLHGKTHVLTAGDEITIPPDTPHVQKPGSAEPGRIRIRLTPSGRSDEFFTRLAELEYNRFGFPKPLSGAKFVRELGEAGHAARPSLKTQQRIAALLDDEYTFVDEWDVAAPPEDVFDALADGTTYPQWWKGVYISATEDGEYTHQHFKGRLPYHLHTRTRTIHSERPHRLQGETDGDLRGTGIWTLSENADGGTHVRFDWQVHADRRLLKLLTPFLRPVLRWNHTWAIARAMDGLEPYVRERVKLTA